MGLPRLITLLALAATVTACSDDDAPAPDAATDATVEDAQTDATSPCGDVPLEGRCLGNRLQTCEGTEVREQDCTDTGERCLAGDDDPPRCGPDPGGCVHVGRSGLCVGDELAICHGTVLKRIRCDDWGGRCVRDGPRPGCVPREAGPTRFHGRITRDVRRPSPSGLGPVESAPADGLTVVIRDVGTDAALGFGVTDSEGRFDIPCAAPTGPVSLRAVAAAFDGAHRLWVTDGDERTYTFDGPQSSDASATEALDLHVSEADDSGALHIFALLRRHQTDAQQLAGVWLPALQAVWERGEAIYCGTCFAHWPPTLFALGDPQDTDEFDDSVLSHEFGHYLSFTASRDDSPGGMHDGQPTDPRQAWSEGLATWIGQTLLGEAIYLDTTLTGVTVRDPEDMGWDADPQGGLSQALSEYVVLEVLWDLTDPVDGALDPLASPAANVFDVLVGYLPSDTMADRGVAEVDLVDFLDGWLCRGHGDPAGLTALVIDDQGFPYDFAGPTTCDKPRSAARVTLQVQGDRVTLDVVDPLGTDHAEAVIRLPPRFTPLPGHDLGPLAPGERRTLRWTLAPGTLPAWIAAGVTVARGARSQEHAGARWVRPPR